MGASNNSELTYAYYPGCSIHGTARDYGLSIDAVCSALGMDLVEIPDWNCCGASSAHGTDNLLSAALPARNLAIACKMQMDVAVPCAACFNRLAVANMRIREEAELRQRVETALSQSYDGSANVRTLLDIVINDAGLEAIKEKVVRPLDGLKAACYYGCLMVRPPDAVAFDRPEDPQILDQLVAALGAEPVAWPHKTECCGASFSLTRTDIVMKLTGDVLRMAKRCGAECIVCACPLCMANLDMRQATIEKVSGQQIGLPVLYFTEMMGLAMSLPGVESWLRMHMVNAGGVIRRLAAVQDMSDPALVSLP
ncbi:MAG: CoB--CoM heterodisulfide reductase iron-sulfur subunit B family protein [Armatimonadetes bacterium]|nr:CoB--CoM heterodisulfide reductase iron-sulfur subunit B family protein [Armatimonadota bacterium]